MKITTHERANVILCVLATILIVSFIAATVLQSSTTRLNASSSHVRGWKEALLAAETAGDIGFAEIRKSASNDAAVRASQWAGWTKTETATTLSYTSPETTFGSNNLRAQTVVDACYFKSDGTFSLTKNPSGNHWYRLRSRGIAPLPNLRRTGMDDTLVADNQLHFAAFGSTAMKDITARGKGDSLLRKIDFQYDHFVSTYGPNGDNLNKALVPAPYAPSISRRIEQVLTPVTPFYDAAIKCAGSFYGLGSAAQLDSYDSRVGPYVFCANNPSHPRYVDSRKGSLQIGSSTATVKGMLYGDVATNGGNIVGSSQITGTIDNNVPFTMEDYQMPDTSSWTYRAPGSGAGQLPATVTTTQTLTPPSAGTAAAPNYYVISSLSGNLTINPVGNEDTFVAIRVNGGDITGAITVNGTPDQTKGVRLKVYFDYNVNTKNSNLSNKSPTATNPFARNLQFYGISPPRASNGTPVRTQKVDLASGTPGLFAATFYAPSADIQLNGNPDFIGTMVCKSFYSNGNISWHYDRALNEDGDVLDFRVVSYVEDTR